jgi:cytochrome o ubiquinol oxidase subunit 2
MSKFKHPLFPVIVMAVLLTSFLVTLVWYMQHHTVALFHPAGLIALQEHRLFVFAVLLSLVGLVPVFTLAVVIAIKYRAGRTTARYTPNWQYHKGLSLVWLAVLVGIIGTVGVVSWRTTHQLDPYRPLADNGHQPLTIEVVALQWKWLFIYPGQGIATVNHLTMPVDTPVTFRLTADAPMNSFWLPQLAGQMYAMEGMVTQLHLQADQPGTYQGVSAEISGEEFASMRFTAQAVSQPDFTDWVTKARLSSTFLDQATYDQLAKPARQTAPITYSGYQPGLYDTIVMKFMPKPADHSAADAGIMTTNTPAMMMEMP